MILKNIIGEKINLLNSELFKQHCKNNGSYADFLVQQLNTDNLKQFFDKKYNINVIDLGSNVGLWSLYLAPICKNIIAIEPTPSHCHVANDLFSLFNQQNNITLINAAISDIDGYKNFFIGSINSTMNSFYHHSSHNQTIEVKTYKLKTLIKELNIKIDFLKMDIEGSEQQVILDSDFDQFIFNNVDNIYMEIHDSLGANYQEIYNKLLLLEYNIEKIGNDTLYAFK